MTHFRFKQFSNVFGVLSRLLGEQVRNSCKIARSIALMGITIT